MATKNNNQKGIKDNVKERKQLLTQKLQELNTNIIRLEGLIYEIILEKTNVLKQLELLEEIGKKKTEEEK